MFHDYLYIQICQMKSSQIKLEGSLVTLFSQGSLFSYTHYPHKNNIIIDLAVSKESLVYLQILFSIIVAHFCPCFVIFS